MSRNKNRNNKQPQPQPEKITDGRFQTDAFFDPISGRGNGEDKTQRLLGQRVYRTPYERMKQYQASGFLQNITKQPAEDATREFIDVTTNRDDDLKINRMIEKRLDDLQIRKKIKDMVRFSRMYEKGSMLFYGVDEDVPMTDAVLTRPMDLNKLKRINYINVIEEPDRFYFFILNRYDPTKDDYNKVSFYIMGRQVDASRLDWIVEDWYPMELMGLSQIETCIDAVNALDSALWSCSSLMMDMASTVFTSDLVSTLSPDKLYEVLWSLKNQKNTQSVVGLKPGETFEKVTYTLTGIKEIFDFLMDYNQAVSRMPQKILFGTAQGIIGAGEYDSLNYYAQIAKFQEHELRPILKHIIDMIIHEQTGKIFMVLGGGVDQLDYDFKFKSLYKIAPLDEATMQYQAAQRDSLDIQDGKLSPEEARTLDPRMDELEDFTDYADINMPVPPLKNGPDSKPQDIPDLPVKPPVSETDLDKQNDEVNRSKPGVETNWAFRKAPK